MEVELTKYVKKGKNVFIMEVSNPEHITSNTRGVNLRNKTNKKFNDMSNKLKGHNKKSKVEIIKWSPFHDEDDYHTIKAVSEKAIVSYLQKIDDKIGGKLRAPYLDRTLTAHAYSNVEPTYPFGCYKCTKIGHTESSCTIDLSKKRNRSDESDQGPAPKVTSTNDQ